MKVSNLIKNELRMLLKRKTVTILIVSFVMIVPYIAILNADTPTQDDHYFYNEMDMAAFNVTTGSNGNLYYHTLVFKGFVVNKYLQPVRNTMIDIENVTLNGSVNVTVKTNSNGIFNVTKNYTQGIDEFCFSVPNDFISERTRTENVRDYQVLNLGNNYLNFYIPGIQGSQSDVFHVHRQFELSNSTFKINYSSIVPGQSLLSGDISYSILPYYNLGLYGVAPVIYNSGNKNITLYISEAEYNKKLGTFTDVPNSSTEINVSAESVVEPFGYSHILSINKAGAIKIYSSYINSGKIILSIPYNSFNFGSSLIVFAYLLGTLTVSLIVISVVTEIYGLPEREVYTSLPHKRRNLIFMKLFTGLASIILATVFGVAFGEILDLVFFHSLISPYVILIGTLILLSMFLLLSPIFLFIESKKTLSSGARGILVFFITLFVPLIISIGMGILEAYLLSSAIITTDNYLTEPLLRGAGEINLIFSLIPFSAPMEMIDYLTYTPFPQVTMFNHRSLFLLTPLIIIPDLLIWFFLILWASIRKYSRN
ncbi:hypothetical protein [Cuniculiplasma sp. SKW4]|uniref:hypothetical protein n=1 Tax=Cuniculiplasma sp. SKW4 TaxID=3400171 RepID=UPI003FD390DB